MGITGLIPFLEKASRKINIKDIRGHTVAIDSYCWLHKGAFACAEKLSRGEDTDTHIQYCLKYVNLLLGYDIKPILVFDGRHLPAKALTEKRRRESRDNSKKRAAELLRLGRYDEARSHMRRCVDITHEMALRLIKECRKRNVDCIVAPYEADAQMAYLNKLHIAEYIITEDSDLVLFGCQKIIFKLDLNGNGLLVEADKLNLAMGCRPEKFTFDKFRYMCILSGCDYLDSLPGIGLAKACKFILKTEETEMRKLLMKIPQYLNMRNLTITAEYISEFCIADATFKHMFVYDPFKRKMVRLNDPSELGTDLELCSNAGNTLDDETAFHLALGNLDPFTLKRLDDWIPGGTKRAGGKTKSFNQCAIAKHKSIWESDFKINSAANKTTRATCAFEFKKVNFSHPRNLPQEIIEEEGEKNEFDVVSLYTHTENDIPPSKRPCRHKESPLSFEKSSNDKSPTKNIHNPFFKNNETDSSSKNVYESKSLLKVVSPINQTNCENNDDNVKPVLKQKLTSLKNDRQIKSRFFLSNISAVQRNEECGHSFKANENIAITTGSIDESLKVVSNIKASLENFTNESTVLYQSSLNKDKVDASLDSVVNNKQLQLCNSLDSGVGSIENSTTSLDFLSKFDYKNKVKQVDTCIITINDKSEDTIVLSDTESIDVPKKKIQVRPKARQVGLRKRKLKSSNQSRLSMFGFEKRPSIK